jgi:hypothetical protein
VGRVNGAVGGAKRLVRTRVLEQQLRQGMPAILAQKAARPAFRRLWDAEVSVFSQWGEDGILDYLCDFLGLGRPSVVEFGAADFQECNSRFLAEYRNANVLAVDGRPDLESTVKKLFVGWRTTVEAVQAWITPDNADALLNRARSAFGRVDVLSLDIDGNDYWVAESLDLTGVSIVVVEYQPLFGGALPVSVPRNDTFDRTKEHYSWLYYGASLRAFVQLFEARGFTLVGTNRPVNNAFFVRSDRLQDFPLELPDTASDLAEYVDGHIRESRDRDGKLDHLSGRARVDVMAEMPLVNTSTGDRVTVGVSAQAVWQPGS